MSDNTTARPFARPARAALAVLLSVVALAARPDAGRAQPPSTCSVTARRVVEPAALRQDESIGVSIEVTANCLATPLARQFVIALAPWPTAAEVDGVRTAVNLFLDSVDFGSSTVALVLGHPATPLVLGPTSDPEEVRAALAAYRPSVYGSDDAALLATAARVFYNGRAPAGRRHTVLVTHAEVRPSTPEALANASFDARWAGVWVTDACVGGECSAIPRSERLDVPDLTALSAVLPGIAARPARLELDQLTMRDELAGNTSYVAGSANPPASRIGETVYEMGDPVHRRGFIEWTIDRETERIDGRYVLRPAALGTIQTHTRLVVEGMDTAGGWFQREIRGASVTVEPAPPVDAACRMYGAAGAGPGPLPLDSSVPVTIALTARCPSDKQDADVVLLVDRSWSTRGRPLEKLVRSAEDFIHRLDLEHVRAAVVSYNDEPEVRQPLTSDRASLLAALKGLQAVGNTNPRDAVLKARELLLGRRAGAMPVIVMFYDGYLSVDPAAGVEWARMEGIRIATVCFQTGYTCASGVASPAEYAVEAREPEDLAPFWDEFVPSLVERNLSELIVTHHPTTAMPYDREHVPPPADPPAVLADGRLRWNRSALLANRTSFHYPLRARAVGRWDIADRIEVTWREQSGATGAAILPVPAVEVLAPADTGPCSLSRADRSALPARVRAGDAVTVTSRVDLECPPADLPLQVMLVIDHSASMGAGTGRLDAVRRAVRAMLTASTSQQWLFGVVSFNDEVTGWVDVTENRQQVIDLVDGLTPGGTTNIGAAIAKGGELLAAARGEVPQVMIVLTDGANTAGSGPVLAAADAVKREGVVLVAVCAGGECDPELPNAASDPSYYFSVPDAADLVALFEKLSRELIRSVTALVVEEQIAPWFSRSVMPPDPVPDDVGEDWLRWKLDVLPVGGASIAHQVVPSRPGIQPVSRYTSVEYTTYGKGGVPASGRVFLPAPLVDVLGTPTSGPAVPTLGPPPADTPTPSPTTPTPAFRAFLPRLDRD